MSSTPGIVVVGAGLAAAKAVESMREAGHAGTITLIGEEPERPYERPALSKDYLQGNGSKDDLFVHPEEWYAEHDVVTRFGETATSIDRDARTVSLASGDTVPYERLLITTGSRPRTLELPGADLDGVVSLRRIGDSDRIREAYARASSVVIIGAGWIGLETAAAARAAGLPVTVLEYAPLPLGRVLGDELATYFADLHRRNGVDLRTSVEVTAITGTDGRVSGVRVGEEEIAADLVIVGVGISPNAELAAEAGLEVDNGILVDEHLRTSDPAIYAAGDVANAYNSTLGDRLRVEHWDNAIRQGQLAGRTVLGRDDTYDWQPYFYTDQFDLGMEYVGRGGAADDVVIRGDKAGGEFIAFWLDGDRVTAGMNVNVWDVNDDLRALVGSSVDRSRLAEPDVPLTEVVTT
ncbi:NAD(P)/FAD-dependent oxidoreductase [Aeromicrobium ginsengisoli]|uniref:Ferredoxin reductase n=1 Tax=Aeromicrobium ginsengisoli TaxID=363867 RepID=A0A5M4FAA2_9ACTN|nr:FAD-dependent oxidoreductase [Aeromicrobium ginsengisoli]KAA1395323.1 ferredoxin reductase [Aeromicrobium ginsengisoli]